MREDVDRKEKPRDTSYQWARREFDHLPNGKLFFKTEGYYGESERSRWGDGKRQKLENIINEVVGGLRALLDTRRAEQLDRECRERQKLAVTAVRKATTERREAEELRAKKLVTDADSWKRASEIRGYLAERHRKIAAGQFDIVDEEKNRLWSEWAAWYADSIDPLVKTPQHPDRPKPPSNLGVAELDFTRATRELVAKLGVADAEGLVRLDFQAVESLSDRSSGSDWEEIGRVLEALGYDVTSRSRRS